MVMRFALPDPLPAGGVAYTAGEILASGMRNEVGLAVDRAGRLWGVGNGRNDAWLAPGMDIHDGNPAEELHRIEETAPRFYGYPSCWTEFMLASGAGAGTLHADPQVTGVAAHDDAWCRDPGNVRPAAFAMPAHWAPLGLVAVAPGVFPAAWTGDLLVPSHGSTDSTRPIGRLIARAHLGADGTVLGVAPVVGGADASGQGFGDGLWADRPVDIVQGVDGAMYVTADEQGLVLRLGYR
jgi:glucose/arabinose dehydrogenase